MQPPSVHDVYRARQVVYRHLAPTPLIRSAAMSEALGCDIYLKLGDRLRGRRVVLIVSGCNITKDQLRRVLTDPHPW